MYISRLALDHFRSWDACVLDFDKGINILQGHNGLGKTNIVESVEVLSTGSSQRTTSTGPLIQRGNTTAVIRANIVDNGVTTLEMSIHARGANRMRVNSGPSRMMRDVLGTVSCVSFSPQDQHLVTEDPTARRLFLNQAGTQLNIHYDSILHKVRHIAQQRVALLKQLNHNNQSNNSFNHQASVEGITVDPNAAALSGLEVWTGQFIEAGSELTLQRMNIVKQLNENFSDIYRQLSGNQGTAELIYKPSFEEVLQSEHPFDEISAHFQRIFQGELARGFNLIGPQRDDLEFSLDGYPAREYASNGEQWTMAIALKMSLYQTLQTSKGEHPIIILDDVFAQLDEVRRKQIIDFASAQHQVLITVAAASDIPELGDANIIDVQQLHDDSEVIS